MIETQKQALAEARKRFGGNAWADEVDISVRIKFQVGRDHMCFGEGNTWDAAFADADKRGGVVNEGCFGTQKTE